jgi:hypothetical protein
MPSSSADVGSPVPVSFRSDEDSLYRLANVSSVKDVWEEYYQGINSGPSILSLESGKRKWRYMDDSEIKKLSRRKKLIEYIKNRATESESSHDEVISALDVQRGKRALTSFIDELTKKKKQ